MFKAQIYKDGDKWKFYGIPENANGGWYWIDSREKPRYWGGFYLARKADADHQIIWQKKELKSGRIVYIPVLCHSELSWLDDLISINTL